MELASLVQDLSSISSYAIDINNDNTFDRTSTNGTFSLDWATLESYGLTGDGVYTI